MTSDAPLVPDALYHLATPAEWESYEAAEMIVPRSFEHEGFVHCSYGRQVPGTVARHFQGVEALLALEIDRRLIGDVPVVDEDTMGGGQAFPHAYGPLPVVAVRSVTRL